MPEISRSLYDKNYYKTSCEGYNNSVDNLSTRLGNFFKIVGPQLYGTVSDIGFGRGELSIRAARLDNVKKVYAYDYSLDAAEIFISSLKKEPEHIIDKISITVDDILDSYDTIAFSNFFMMVDVIEHLPFNGLKRLINDICDLTTDKIFVSTPISNAKCNERHVWLARSKDDVASLLPWDWECNYLGPAGIGEDHFFEFKRKPLNAN